jgi:hypothetical protein
VSGEVRLFNDVVVHRNGVAEWIALSREAAATGELVFLDLEEDGAANQVAVWVIESRPVLLDGDMRYRIRLHSDDMAPILFEQQVRRG